MNQYKRLKEFDIVVSHFYPMNLLAYKARKQYKIKYIYHNHGIDTSSYSNFFHKIYMGLFQIFTNITLKNVDKAYSVSTYLKDELKKTSGLDSEVVYNKIDKKIFNNKVKGNKIINRYNSKNKKILLYVGRIAPHKGIHLLLKSFNIIKNKIPNVKLLIVGKPTHNSYFNKIKRLANKEVIFTGYVDDEELPQYFAASDLYVTASLWEGFDIPAASAQKCGKKVVAFDIGSHPEIVKNGKLIKSGDVKEFANAAVEMLK